jgi:hypothetical protein
MLVRTVTAEEGIRALLDGPLEQLPRVVRRDLREVRRIVGELVEREGHARTPLEVLTSAIEQLGPLPGKPRYLTPKEGVARALLAVRRALSVAPRAA